MRHDYHEIAETNEYDLEDGRVLVVERHRRRRWSLPSLGGGGSRGGPLALAAFLLIGGGVALVLSVVGYQSLSGAIGKERTRYQADLARLQAAEPTMDDDGVITVRDKKGRPRTLRPGDKNYDKVRSYIEALPDLSRPEAPPPAPSRRDNAEGHSRPRGETADP